MAGSAGIRIARILVANRGEIAIRICRAAAELGIETVAVYSADDDRSLHVRKADRAVALDGKGAAPYLDAAAIVAVAVREGCQAIHPGYGFLSENAGFAAQARAAGVEFIGPSAAALALFGDKVRARDAARAAGVPVIEGSAPLADVAAAQAFLASLGGAAGILKAVGGGGGRGMRVVRNADDVAAVFERASAEALKAFGNGALFMERFIARARHIEVQVIGDLHGQVTHLHERECTLQRQNQKIVEIAPSPSLPGGLRRRILDAAVGLARSAGYASLGTMEFLVDADDLRDDGWFAFIEANPRLQVEHTVTEAVTGIDLVGSQIRIAGGALLADLGIDVQAPPAPRGHAIQMRVNMETMAADGSARPAGGTLTAFDPPTGPGVRTDTFGYSGYKTSARFDSLLAKVIVHAPGPDYADAVRRARRALAEFRIEGVRTNLPFLQRLLAEPEVERNAVFTRYIETHVERLIGDESPLPQLWFESPAGAGDAAGAGGGAAGAKSGRAGVRVDTRDPLAVLKVARVETVEDEVAEPVADGVTVIAAPLQGTIVELAVAAGATVRRGQPLLVMEAMKMEHVIGAPSAGRIVAVLVEAGETVYEAHVLLHLEPGEQDEAAATEGAVVDLDAVRPDLAESIRRHAFGLDEHRPEAVAKRHARRNRTARENVFDLIDGSDTWVEYGALVIAAQRRRRSVQDLMENTSGDGMVCGIGQVNGALFDERAAQCAVMSYDYMVLAGTQGGMNHLKKDRIFELVEALQIPLVLFAEGGGGRPGDTDGIGVAGLDCFAFNYFARLSGLVPLVGITNDYCFAGNAALLGCCDVIIATASSNIGMGGPAMVEGGGLGVFSPKDIGPMSVQTKNGVVDIAVKDEAEAVRVAKQYLGYFQGAVREWSAPDQRHLRHVIPENRLRVYEIRSVIEALADTGSVLELRRAFGIGIVTALVRIEGRPLGIIANNPAHLGGAIDADAADKATRFMQLCDGFDLPLLFLCDTPGFMVGPEAEKQAQVRKFARMFVNGANLTVPFFTIVLRKGYGLGAQAMAGGGFKIPLFTVSWPTGEFGGMGLEGAVKLGYRKELEAETDPAARQKLYQEMVDRMYERGKAVNTASTFELDDVIDPADSRRWIMTALRSAPRRERHGKKRPCIDAW